MIKKEYSTQLPEYLPNQVLPILEPPKKIGEILVEMGALKPDKLEAALKKQQKLKRKKRLGEILVEEGYVDSKTVKHALVLQSFITMGALMASLFIGHFFDVSNSAYAATKSKPLEITVSVKPHWSISVNYQKQSIHLSEEDVRRGYIDIPNATGLTIKDTSRSGFLLLFEGLSEPFKSVSVRGLPNAGEVIITSKSALIHQQNKKSTINLNLSYRFYLSEGAKPGEYSWPITITLQPA